MRLAVVALLVLGVVILGIYLFIRFSEPPEIAKPECDVDRIVQLQNGLSKTQREEFYHDSFGSEMLPSDWLQALVNPNTGNPLLNDLDRFGLMCDPNNPDGLPIGFSTTPSKVLLSKRPMTGMNCSICHVAELRYKDKYVRVDGAPSQFNTTRFVAEFGESLEALKDPKTLLDFLRRLHAIRTKTDVDAAPKNLKSLEGLHKQVVTALGQMKSRLDYFAQLKRLKGQVGGTPAGPGRADTWVTGRNSIFPEHAISWTSPSSYPHLWGYDDSIWLTWNGTTQSGADRDVATALGMMTFFNMQTYESSLLPQALFHVDRLISNLKSPKWPAEVFGRIDQNKFDRGKVLFKTHCAECHENRTLVTVEKVGTDRQHELNYHKPVGDELFHEAFPKAMRKFKEKAYLDNNVPQEEIGKFERERPNVWRASDSYASRRLNGIWATAPYLHNGSVPTLYDLLLPAAERPQTFTLGSRDYDPKNIGFESDPNNDKLFKYDITLTGNSNKGHEYGVDLKKSERYDLLEYLKGI